MPPPNWPKSTRELITSTTSTARNESEWAYGIGSRDPRGVRRPKVRIGLLRFRRSPHKHHDFASAVESLKRFDGCTVHSTHLARWPDHDERRRLLFCRS